MSTLCCVYITPLCTVGFSLQSRISYTLLFSISLHPTGRAYRAWRSCCYIYWKIFPLNLVLLCYHRAEPGYPTGSEMESNEGGRGLRRRQCSAESRRLWALVEPYRRPPRLMPLLVLNVVGFYTGLVAAAVTEQLCKEKYWEEHPRHAVSIMHPLLYFGPYKVTREDFSEEASG